MPTLSSDINCILESLQALSTAILIALTLVAFLQTLSLYKKKRLIGIAVTLCIALLAVFTSPLCSRTRPQETIKAEPSPLSSAISKQESGIERYGKLMTRFSSEMHSIAKSIEEMPLQKSLSEFDAETQASKALAIKERANKFFSQLNRAYRPNEASDLHKGFVSAAEHLRLAAFALHAGISSDDKAFQDLQREQQNEQLKIALDSWNSISETLSKLSPEFYQTN